MLKTQHAESQKQNKELKAEIKTQLNSKDIFFNNRYVVEKTTERGLCDMTSLQTFDERFSKLIYGLPTESIETLVTIIKRLQMIKNSKGDIDLFSSQEKEILRDIKNKKKHILKISENKYAYQNYLLPINHFAAGVFYHKNGMNELYNKEYFINKAIIDVGAYVGDSACILSPYTNDKVYCFEAVKKNYDYMQQTIEMNNLSNIVPEKLALGDKDGEFEINVMGSSSSIDPMMVSQPTSIEKCSVTTLDNYLQDKNIEVGLIKVDIEGTEQLFLKGAINTIKEHKPTMLISIYHNINDFLDIKPMIESWNLGYKFKIFKPTNSSVLGETLLICEI